KLFADIGGTIISGAMHTHVGADEPGSLKITSLAKGGTTYTTDGATTTLTSGGSVIFLYGFGTSLLTGSTDTNSADGLDPTKTVFTVTLDPATDTYQVNLIKPIDNGSGISLEDLGFATAGNKAFNFIDVGGVGNPQDILFSGFHVNQA